MIMKKLIIAAIVAINLQLGLSAQDAADLRDRALIGLKAGGNYSNVYNERGENFVADPKLGWAAGAFVSIPMGTLIGLHPEILFSQKGFHGNGRLLGSEYNFTRTTNFVDVPVFFAIKPTTFFTFLIGPQYSYLIKQKDEFGSGPNSYVQEQEFNNENIRKNILSFALGADINTAHMVYSLRACWDVQKNHGDGTSSIPQYKNVWYQGTIGYRFY
jgi:hypothetical protein